SVPPAEAERITPPLLHPSVAPGNTVTIKATITGLPVKEITSNTHAIRTTAREDGNVHEVTLRAGEALPNADFHLDIGLAGGEEPAVSLVTTEAQDAKFAMVTVFPPLGAKEDRPAPRVPRDVLFLIDTSGSMAGESMGQAQAGLLRCLDMLQPEDAF